MLKKLLVFTMSAATCATITAATANAQQMPNAPTERRVQRMAFNLPFEASYLGVQTEDISRENFSKYGLPAVRGVGIDQVVENSPAAKAGLRKGDVILKFEGENITSVRKLTRLISETAPDHAAQITVWRDGREREISVTLGKREMPQFSGGNFQMENLPNFSVVPSPRLLPTAPLSPSADNGDSGVFVWRTGANRQIGVGVTPLTKQLGEYFGVAEGRGLLVNSVRENSPAAKAGLKAGDVIVEIEGKEVKAMTDLIGAVNEKKDGAVSMTFVRERSRQTVQVTPEIVKEEKMTPREFQNFFETKPDINTEN